MAVGTQTILKWIIAGVVASIVATIGFFSEFGTPLVNGLVMIAIGVGVLMFIGTKQLGLATSIPAGFIIAGALVLSVEFVVPLFNKTETA